MEISTSLTRNKTGNNTTRVADFSCYISWGTTVQITNSVDGSTVGADAKFSVTACSAREQSEYYLYLLTYFITNI